MRAKILLHGGMLRADDPRNNAYFKELVSDLIDGDEVLFIGFARTDLEDRYEQFSKEVKWLKAQTNKDIRVVNATPNDIVNQIKNVKSIEITGGEASELIKDIQKIPNFLELIKGKTVGGSSAGACLFSKYYYSHRTDSVLEGLGVFPIKLNVHDNNPAFGDSIVAKRKLEEIDEDMEYLALDECEWVSKFM